MEQNGVQISTKVSTQDGLRSLLGLKLPFSNCPVVSRLRPMAYLHVPLGGTLHTNFRFIGMHLVAQYLRALDGKKPDWELKGLQQLIKELNQVNRGLAARIRSLASEVLWNIELSLEDLRPLFEAYIESD